MFARFVGLRAGGPSRPKTGRNRLLGCELLEPRTMLSATMFGTASPLAVGSLGASPVLAGVSITPSAGNTLNGTSEQLLAQGLDQSGKALSSSLRYTWSVNTLPQGAANPAFSVSGSSAAQDTAVTFKAAGTYGLTVVVADSAGHSATSTITVTVNPVLSSVRVTAATSGAITGTNQQLTVQELDQFGNTMAPVAPTYRWSIASAPAGAAAPGFSVAAATTKVTFGQAGNYSLTATVTDGGRSISGTLAASVVQTVTRVVVSPVSSPVSGTSLGLSAQADDQFGKAMAAPPQYTWSVSTLPNGAGNPTFSVNSSSAAASPTATFKTAGTYGLTVVAADSAGHSAAGTLTVTVNPVFTGVRVTAASSGSITGTSQQLTVQELDQFGNTMAPVAPTYRWSIASAPAGAAAPSFSAAAATTTVTFAQAGSYGLAVTVTDGGKSVSGALSASVVQTLSHVVVGPVSSPVSGTSLGLSAQGVDQFGKGMTAPPQYTWSISTLPKGAGTPTFSVNSSSAAASTTATFKAAGTYGLAVTVTDGGKSVSGTLSASVVQTLTGITVNAAQTTIAAGAACQCTALAVDQFQMSMATQPSIVWSASSGTISSSGLFTAPLSGGTASISARNGTVSSSISVAVNGGGGSKIQLQDPVLNALVNSLAAAGPINRTDMIQILDAVANEGGTVSATDMNDLKTILKDATQLNVPDYVQVLAGDIVNGSLANANYQGQALGNLAAGSRSIVLTDLVNKWFLGLDHPDPDGYGAYEVVSGSLFANNTPSYNDVVQGSVGDCYLMSALGAIAQSSPAAIRNMFIDNGDGTWTVRFYWNGAADYVTVDKELPVYYGDLFYAGRGEAYNNPHNVLWVDLAEKAYAQWNETLREEGRNGVNSYVSLNAGWTGTVSQQVLGQTSTDYFNYSSSSATMEQAVINGLAGNEAVTMSITTPDPVNNIIGNHAYMVIGYSNGLFQLANPWGRTWDPGPLSWNVLWADGLGVSVSSTSGSVPISAAAGGHGIAANTAALTSALDDWYEALGADDSLDTVAANRLATSW